MKKVLWLVPLILALAIVMTLPTTFANAAAQFKGSDLMKTLIIYAHPNPLSFNAAIAATVREELEIISTRHRSDGRPLLVFEHDVFNERER